MAGLIGRLAFHARGDESAALGSHEAGSIMTSNPQDDRSRLARRLSRFCRLRDIVVFPHMIVPLFVGREKSNPRPREVMRATSRFCWRPR